MPISKNRIPLHLNTQNVTSDSDREQQEHLPQTSYELWQEPNSQSAASVDVLATELTASDADNSKRTVSLFILLNNVQNINQNFTFSVYFRYKLNRSRDGLF